MSRIICNIIHPGDRFTTNWQKKTISADASSLPSPFHSQLYDDAADSGFRIMSRKTGRIASFYLAETVIIDSEIVAWEFAPCNLSLKENPGLQGYRVTVFND